VIAIYVVLICRQAFNEGGSVMSQRIRRLVLPCSIAVVAVVAGVGAGIAYASNPTQSRPGPPVAYAEIDADGSFAVDDDGPDAGSARVRNIEPANVSHPATGTYCFGGLNFDPRSALVSGANGGGQLFTLATVQINPPGELIGCGPTDTVRVRTIDNRTQALTDERFVIWFED
jgi:hypothetical protein